MSDIFKPPSGTPARKPSYVVQYPNYPNWGGGTFAGAVKRNDLAIRPPGGGKSVKSGKAVP